MKHISLLLIFVCFVTVNAQNNTINDLIADFERSKEMSLAYIDAMPEDKYDFKPTEGSRTFAEQMLHIAQGIIGLASNGTGEARIFSNVNLEKETSLHSKSEVRRVVSESYDFAINGIQNMDPNTLEEIVVRGPYEVSRQGWIRKANEHAGHHRAQCAPYLRLQGITPPSYKLF